METKHIPEGNGGLIGGWVLSILFKLFSFIVARADDLAIDRLIFKSSLSLALSTTFLASFKLIFSKEVPFICIISSPSFKAPSLSAMVLDKISLT